MPEARETYDSWARLFQRGLLAASPMTNLEAGPIEVPPKTPRSRQASFTARGSPTGHAGGAKETPDLSDGHSPRRSQRVDCNLANSPTNG